MEFSVGVGLTNACDLACAHCYRDTERVDDTSFDARLAAQGPRWKAMGINYYHSDQIAWPAGS